MLYFITLAKELRKTKIVYLFTENEDYFFLLAFNPPILMLFVKLLSRKGE